MPHILHTIWVDKHEPTNHDSLWIKPMKRQGTYGVYVYGVKGWTIITADFKGTIGEFVVDQLPEATPESNGVMSKEDKAKLDNINVYYKTTEEWRQDPYFVPEAGALVIYSDGQVVDVGGVQMTIACVKVGDGVNVVGDLSFSTPDNLQKIYDHINKTDINLSDADRARINELPTLEEYESVVEGKQSYYSGDAPESPREGDIWVTTESRKEYINGQWVERGAEPTEVVKYVPQSLTPSQITQARENLDLYRDIIVECKSEINDSPLAQVSFYLGGAVNTYTSYSIYNGDTATTELPTKEQLLLNGKYRNYSDTTDITDDIVFDLSEKTFMIGGSIRDGIISPGNIIVTEGNDTIVFGVVETATVTFSTPGIYLLSIMYYPNVTGLYWGISDIVKVPERFLPEQTTLVVDDVPTEDSDNLVKSGGVYSFVDEIVGDIETLLSQL